MRSTGIVQRGNRPADAALVHQFARAAFAAAAAGGHAQLQLDVIEAHARMGVADNFAVGNTFADADDHGENGLEERDQSMGVY